MKYLLLVILTLSLQINIVGQVIPEDRRVDWESIVENINIKQPEIQLNVKEFGAIGDGLTNDQPAIMDAIENLDGRLGYIFFPEGNYLVNAPVTLPDSCILKGDGSKFSTLTFDLNGMASNCISISKSQTNEFTEIFSGLNKGSNLISVSDITSFNIGDYIEIRQKNGSWDIVPISWGDYSVGQVTRVVSIVNNKLLIESPLRIDYSIDLDPEVRTITPVSNSGIQCLKIKRLDEPVSGGGANIFTSNAANCFIRGVESDSSVGAHISINSSINILVDGNYFHHGFTYDGTGMRGYGVALSHHTSECLITNNIFRYLRHAMMIKTGSNGNIFSYNYSLEPNRSEPISDASGDISFHGHFPFSNLWEGNIVQNIVIDHYWGPSGPYNTLFRNRAELWGIIMTTNDFRETDKQNFVGSEITNTEFLHGVFSLTGEDHFLFGNNILGEISPSGTNDLPDVSYYLNEPPEFWSAFMDWPSIGTPVDLGTGTIPAKIRYIAGQVYTICPDSLTTLSEENIFDNNAILNLWPNPATTIINIDFKEEINETVLIEFYNFQGNKILSSIIESNSSKRFMVNTTNLSSGIYLLKAWLPKKVYSRKVIISK